MDEKAFDVTQIIPSREIVDLGLLPDELSTKVGFTDAIKVLAGQDLPHFFPNVPDFVKARNSGVTTNAEYRDDQLKLPANLYNSDTYIENLILRGPMEAIIMAYEKQRIKQGLSRNRLNGKGWTKSFVLRFARLDRKPGPEEMKLADTMYP
jgi:hypothetical protein